MSPKSKYTSRSQKNSKTWMILAILGVLLLLTLLGIRLFSNESDALEVGKTPEDFVLTTFSGETINTEDFRGKVVLINFWASWCTTCDEEGELLEAAWRFYQRSNPDQVAFLGVAYADTQPASMAFIENYGLTYPNGPDLQNQISRIYQVGGVPETYILDETGEVTAIKIGTFMSLEEITTAIDTALD
jgi:cytochrome c biogenesis protein CcmG/thiol:disulfide interchange protein DsbE